jgi:hypothetical protein
MQDTKRRDQIVTWMIAGGPALVALVLGTRRRAGALMSRFHPIFIEVRIFESIWKCGFLAFPKDFVTSPHEGDFIFPAPLFNVPH